MMALSLLAMLAAAWDPCARPLVIVPEPLPPLLSDPGDEVAFGIGCTFERFGRAAVPKELRKLRREWLQRCSALLRPERRLGEADRVELLEKRVAVARQLLRPLNGEVILVSAQLLRLLDVDVGDESAERLWRLWYDLVTDEKLHVRARRELLTELLPRAGTLPNGLPAVPAATAPLHDPLAAAGGFAGRPAAERRELIRLAGAWVLEWHLHDVLRRPDVTPEPELRAYAQRELERVLALPDSVRFPTCPTGYAVLPEWQRGPRHQ